MLGAVILVYLFKISDEHPCRINLGLPRERPPLILLSLRLFSLQRFLVWVAHSTIVKPRPNDRNISTQHIPTLLAQHLQFRPNDPKAPTKRSQHANATCRNVVGRNMLHAFGHRIAMRCDVLGVVGSNSKMVKIKQTTPNMSQHIATRWPNARNMLRPKNIATCCVGMLLSFGWGLTFERNRSQHCWVQHVARNGHPVATRFDMLQVENQTSEHATCNMQHCCPNLAKQLHHAT